MGDNEGQEGNVGSQESNVIEGPWAHRERQLTAAINAEPGRTERMKEEMARQRVRLATLERQVGEIVAHLREKGTSDAAYRGAIVIQMAGGGE